jgi:hypothetical protein
MTPDARAPVEIAVPWPESDDPQVRVSAGACRLRVHSSSEDALVTGSYDDPTGTLPLTVTEEYGTVRVSQQARLSDVRGFKAAVPTLDLGLGVGRRLSLHLATGASDVHLDLGGLGLRVVSLRMGAGSATITFDSPVTGALERLECEAGAASVSVTGLGNASPEQATVVGGAASYDLSFDGALTRDVNAKVTTAGANVVVRIPESTAARVGIVSVLAGLTVRDGFQTWEDSYWTQAGADGVRPLLSVDTSITLGGLELIATSDVEPPGIEPGSR